MQLQLNNLLRKISFLILAVIGLMACKKEEKQAEEDEKIIQQYIAANNLEASRTSSGLYYTIEKEGFGDNPSASSDVRVKYKGYLTNGSVFDESAEEGIRFNLQRVISGWTEGIQLYKPGGKGILLIPSGLGYGSNKQGSIPANSVLIFEIELKQVY